MGLFNKNNNGLLPSMNGGDRRPAEKKEMSKDTKKIAIYTLLLTLAVVFVFYLLLEVADRIQSSLMYYIVMYAYAGILAVLLVTYVIYNHGFVLKGVTPDMLPESWSEERKARELENAARRMKNSKWMLMLIIPFIVTFIAEACYLFIWLGVLEPLFK